VQRYSAEGHQERFAALAREVVTSKPDLYQRPLFLTDVRPAAVAD
jgi:hypothetical protein